MIIKKIIPICVCAILFCGCHPSQEEIVYDLINAENNYNLKEVDQFLTDNFMRYGTDTLNKEEYLDRLKNLKPIESKASILSIQNFDSVIKTEEQICNIVDSLLGITPYIVQKRTYRFVDNKVSSITNDSIFNYEEYQKSFEEKWASFAFWGNEKYDMENETEIANIKKYLFEYKNLPPAEKKQYKNYAHLQGTYISKDCAFYKKLIFKGKRTVTIVDAIFGFPFATSYELDEDIVKISTDQSDLLFEIEDSKTLVGEGFARGTFIKVD